MECRNVQDAILESLESTTPARLTHDIDGHLANCPSCAAFAERQRFVDLRLTGMLAPPELSSAFRKTLRQRIRREDLRLWADSLPEKVHFLSCGLATVVCAVAMPFPATAVLSVGAAGTLTTYLLLTAVRNLLESADDVGR